MSEVKEENVIRKDWHYFWHEINVCGIKNNNSTMECWTFIRLSVSLLFLLSAARFIELS